MADIKTQNEISMASAKVIYDAAEAAQADATRANIAANAAQQNAATAQASADSASQAANSARANLSDIEKVVDAVNWIAEHGSYELTADTAAIEDKFYFTQNVDGTYTQANPTVNPSLQGYYELATSTWTLTEDEEIDESKTYFMRSGESGSYYYEPATPAGGENPSTEGWYELTGATYQATSDTALVEHKLYFYKQTVEGTDKYNLITAHTANPHALGLYELDSVDSSISNYVSSHVSLDSGGLVIQTDNVKSKVRIDGSGVHLINELGTTIATFSDAITLGDASGVHVMLSATNGLEFWNGSTRVAYVDSNTLQITNAQIEQTLRIGKFIWKVQGDNRISLVYSY